MPNMILTFISMLAIMTYVNARGRINSITLSRRKCLVVAESPVYSMVNTPVPMNCPGFICWESQLSVLSKAKITQMYNEFRNRRAIRENLTDAIRMKWHWKLENEALKLIASCPPKKLSKFEFIRNVEGLDNSLTCEYNVASVSLTNPSQEIFLRYFPKFLEENAMLDSDEDQKFRRANVMHFGCALTISNATDGSRFICVYCSKEKSPQYVQEKCPEYTVRNENASEFPHLCHASKYIDLYGCEPKQACGLSQPESRTKYLFGELEKHYVVRSDTAGIWLVINRTIYEMKDNKVHERYDITVTIPSSNSWFLNYTSLSEDSYAYDFETMQLLNSFSLSFLGNDKKRAKRQLDKRTKLSQYQNTENDHDYYPTCCIYLFILNLVLFVGLLVLIHFTYRHYKNKKVIK